jgi:hypothetical protein
MPFNMGDTVSIRDQSQSGSILGIHPSEAEGGAAHYDILYADGSGGMRIEEETLTLISAAAAVEETGKKKKNAGGGIGWNPGAASTPAPSEATPTTTTIQPSSSSPSQQWKPSLSSKLEVKDFQTKSFRLATCIGIVADLGTVDVQYSDDGKDGKGIPVGMCREPSAAALAEAEGKDEKRRKKKEKREKKEGKMSSSGAAELTTSVKEGSETAGSTAPPQQPSGAEKTPEEMKIKSINAILASFSLKELDSTLQIIKALNSIVLGKD